jgi:hypothetical protein
VLSIVDKDTEEGVGLIAQVGLELRLGLGDECGGDGEKHWRIAVLCLGDWGEIIQWEGDVREGKVWSGRCPVQCSERHRYKQEGRCQKEV